MLLTRRVSRSNKWPFSWGAVVGIGCLIIGIAIVKAPAVAWALLGVLLGLLLFQLPAYAWVSVAVLAATLSRLFVATAFVPSITNFFHFPLALGAALIAATRGGSGGSVAKSMGIGSVVLLFLSYISWAFNGGEFLRPLLTWLVFVEPFLIVYALVKMPLPPAKAKLLWKLALGIPLAQIPLALVQAFTLGVGDRVQGTFVGMGTGHHAAGAVALTGTLLYVAKGLSAAAFREKLMWLLVGMLLCIVPILSDAKQNIAAFLPAFMLLLSMFVRSRKTALLIASPLFALALLGALSYYPPLQRLGDQTVIRHVVLAKKQALAIIAHRLSDTPGGWLLGVGPGNSVSRVALMGMDRYLNPKSSVALLGLAAAPLTHEIWRMNTAGGGSLGESSVVKGTYSWAGLFGDLGLVGLGSYLWMSWRLWRYLKERRRPEADAARAALVMVGISGMLFNWLEEPGLTLMVALIVGLSLLSSGDKNASVENLSRP